ncbi:MAG: hypothetical protein MUC68_08420, partial [Burkholderiaceae bacterium]|nr:hypothetical protein [Burkholderiaceae bacterium]
MDARSRAPRAAALALLALLTFAAALIVVLALRRPEPAAIDRAERAPTARSSLVLHDPAASPPDAPLGTEADAVARCVERIRRIEALPRGRDDAWVTDARRA